MSADLAEFGHDYRSVNLQRPRSKGVYLYVCMYTRVLCGTGFSQLYLSLSITCLCVMCVFYRLPTSTNKRNYDARGKVIGLHVFADIAYRCRTVITTLQLHEQLLLLKQ